MLSRKGKPRPGMIKIRDRFPCFGRMAGAAICAEDPTVPILVTGDAGCVQSEHCLPYFLCNGRILDESCAMAIVALDSGMFSGQRKAGLPVVETRPVHDGYACVLPQMILMTGHTVTR
jgi:hypothetical protein